MVSVRTLAHEKLLESCRQRMDDAGPNYFASRVPANEQDCKASMDFAAATNEAFGLVMLSGIIQKQPLGQKGRDDGGSTPSKSKDAASS